MRAVLEIQGRSLYTRRGHGYLVLADFGGYRLGSEYKESLPVQSAQQPVNDLYVKSLWMERKDQETRLNF